MKSRERKNSFIKNNISGYIDPTSSNIQTFDTLVHGIITKKNTLFGSKRKFVFIVGSKISLTGTTKSTK
jgi:hypothetical protein